MKKNLRNALCICLAVGALALFSGCAGLSLSLFSSKHDHVHHHGLEDESKVKIEKLENRIDELEHSGHDED